MDFPYLRKVVSAGGVGNPMFVDDILFADSAAISAMAAISDLRSTDFAILSGFDYSASTYSSGVCFMAGTFYYFSGTLAENKYITPSITTAYNKVFQDLSVKPIYDVYYCIQSDMQYGTMPIFSGNMNQYRFSLKSLMDGKTTVISKAYADSPYTTIANVLIKYDATSGMSVINLPTAIGKLDKIIEVVKTDISNNLVTLTPFSTQTINGLSSYSLGVQYEKIKLVSDNANWILC